MAGGNSVGCCPCTGLENEASSGDHPFNAPLPHIFQKLQHLVHFDASWTAHVHPLLIAYAIVVVLFLLYFCFEDGPWHGSQRAEERYLRFTITLLFFTTLVAWLESPKDVVLGMYESVNGLIMTVVMVHLWERHRKRLILPRFADFRVEVLPPRSDELPKPSPKALRAIREMDRSIVVLMDTERHVSSDQGVFLFIIFILILAAIVQMHPEFMPYLSHYSRVGFWVVVVSKAIQHFYWWNRVRPTREVLKRRLQEVAMGSQDADQQTLELVLETLSVGSLLEVLDDGSKRLLCEGSLKEGLLSVRSKAILVDGLMKSGVSHNDLHLQFVRRLILSCHGMELTKLKDLVDGGGNIYNMMKLIHFDMKDNRVRSEIIWHINAEAQRVREQMGRSLGVKILSDVDDTLYSSGGHFPAGVDTKYPKNVVYPGCLALFKALDQAWNQGTSSCNLVFLSARPHIYKSIAEDLSYRLFRELVQDGCMHSMPTLLPGHKTEGLEAMITFSCRKSQAWRKVGELKYRTYRKFMDLYREYDFMFFGDNGQGDLLAGQLMMGSQEERLRAGRTSMSGPSMSRPRRDCWSHDEEEPSLSPEQGTRLLGVVIHQVLPPQESLALNAPAKRGEAWCRQLEAKGIVHHRSYVGAALAIHQMDPELLSEAQVAEIVRQAADDINDARIMYPEWGKQWGDAEDALRADVDRAAAVLSGAYQLPTIKSTRAFLMSQCLTWPEESPASTDEEDTDSSSDD